MEITSWKNVEQAFAVIEKNKVAIKTIDLDAEKKILPLQSKIDKICEKADEKIEPLQQEIIDLNKKIKAYSLEHRKEVDKTKEFRYGSIHFRVGKESVQLKDSDKVVIDILKKHFRKKYITTKETINKTAILKDWNAKIITDDQLAECEIFIKKEESLKTSAD